MFLVLECTSARWYWRCLLSFWRLFSSFIYFVSICYFSISRFAVLYKYWGWLLLVISIVNSCILGTAVVSIPVVSHPYFLLWKYIVSKESLFVSSSKWRVAQKGEGSVSERAVLRYDANGRPRVEGWLIVDVLQTKAIPSLILQWLRQGLPNVLLQGSDYIQLRRFRLPSRHHLLLIPTPDRFESSQICGGFFRAHRSYDLRWLLNIEALPVNYPICLFIIIFFAGLGWTNSLTLVPPMKRRSGALITSDS